LLHALFAFATVVLLINVGPATWHLGAPALPQRGAGNSAAATVATTTMVTMSMAAVTCIEQPRIAMDSCC
jgi:hypothetical protein